MPRARVREMEAQVLELEAEVEHLVRTQALDIFNRLIKRALANKNKFRPSDQGYNPGWLTSQARVVSAPPRKLESDRICNFLIHNPSPGYCYHLTSCFYFGALHLSDLQ